MSNRKPRANRLGVLVWIPILFLLYGAAFSLMDVCPRCASTDTAPIMYGLPAFNEELDRALENHEIVLGGCVVTPMQPTRYCYGCDREFGFYQTFAWFALGAAGVVVGLAILRRRGCA